MGSDSAQRSSQLTLQLCPEPSTPDSPHVSLVCSIFPLPQPRVSGYKWNFVLAFLRASLSVQLSLPGRTETLLLFTASGYLGSFPGSGAPGWGTRGLDPILLRGNAPSTDISLQNFRCHLWEPSQPSHASLLPDSLVVVSSGSPWL